jgi:hypothetical protein
VSPTVKHLLSIVVELVVAALGLYVAARLIEAVWPALALGAAAVASVVILTMIFRSRYRGW